VSKVRARVALPERVRRSLGNVSFSRAVANLTLLYLCIQPLNQLNISFRTCPWSDSNSDKNAQDTEIAFASCIG